MVKKLRNIRQQEMSIDKLDIVKETSVLVVGDYTNKPTATYGDTNKNPEQ